MGLKKVKRNRRGTEPHRGCAEIGRYSLRDLCVALRLCGETLRSHPTEIRYKCSIHCRALASSFLVALLFSNAYGRRSEPNWSTKLDSRIRFYQITELAVLLVGTEKSLYALDGETGDVLWRRKNARLAENDVAPVAGTDLVLLSYEQGDRTRIEAVDQLTGESLWRADKVRGSPMQMAVDLDKNLLAVVLVKEAKGRVGGDLKRRPRVHVFDLRKGDELWKYEAERDVEMMPVRWGENEDEETAYTLNNYHPPMFLDDRLYVFYDGVASFDAFKGKERIREGFRVNEEGLALTEADPVFNDSFIYVSGRGRVRAIARESSRVEWEAKDLGQTPEMILADGVLFVRTGGQFTELKDGDTAERGPYGVSAIDARTGKTLWRYKGADKGITNIALPDPSTVMIADRDDLILIDARTGKRLSKFAHGIKNAAFVLLNERGEAVVGGSNEIAAFDWKSGQNLWRARHNPPSRGIFRMVMAITLRAASLYFRYGGLGMTVLRGARVARAAGTLRWSGLARAAGPSLTSLATNSAREYVSSRFSSRGIAARADQISKARSLTLPRPSIDVEERLLDRIDPLDQMERLSRFLLRRRRLATLRGERMFFYTDLKRQGGRGLAGVNINTGRTDLEVSLDELDDRFVTDAPMNLLYSSKGDRLIAYNIGG